MVGRQQARNGRKANLFIPQLTIYTSRRTNRSQHCRDLPTTLFLLGQPPDLVPRDALQGASRPIDPPQPKSPLGFFLLLPLPSLPLSA